MGFNTILESMRRGGGGVVDPLEQLARQNEAMRRACEGLERSRAAAEVQPGQVRPDDVVLEEVGDEVSRPDGEEDDDEEVEEVPRAPLSQEQQLEDPSRMPDTLRQKLVLFELRQRNKKLEEELARKELQLAAKKAFLSENYHMLAM